jgi:hypothetical protein
MSQGPFSHGEENPYRSPAPLAESADLGRSEPGGVSQRSIELLRATRPWVRFLSVVGYVAAGLTILGGIAVAVLSMSGQGSASMGGLALVYVLAGGLYVVGAGLLGSYASRIRDLESSRRTESLEEALAAQTSFWKFTGVLMAIVVGLYSIILLIAFAVGITGALR